MTDRQRFEAVYAAHGGPVRAYVARRVSPADADDITAEVFLAVWRRIGEAPSDPLPWLLGIARGVISNRRRGHARELALVARMSAERDASQAGGEDGADSGVLAALAALNPRDRELLLLIAWEGLDHKQAAAALGIRAGTVAVRLHRARRRFAQTLATTDSGSARPGPRSQSRMETP